MPSYRDLDAVMSLNYESTDIWMVVESNVFWRPTCGELERVSGLYARFLPEVGYDFLFEFDHSSPEKPVNCWRVNASGEATG